MSSRTNFLLCAVAGALAFGTHGASARALTVGTCTGADPSFPTIQSAVDVAFSGDRVVVCPGTYAEQVKIKRNLTLSNVSGMASPTIAAPAGGVQANTTSLSSGAPIAAQVLIQPTTHADVTITGITVDGTDNNIQACAPNLIGIYYRNAGGLITRSTVENQLLAANLRGCQSGLAIFVQNKAAGTNPVIIRLNTVTNFNKNGITMNEVASTGEITRNTVTGIGPTPDIAQNGIQLGFGASAMIDLNKVSNVAYTGGSDGATGILLFGSDHATDLAAISVEKNTVDSAQYGVVVEETNGAPGNLLQVTNNRISNSQYGGVGLYSFGPGDGTSADYVNVANNTIQNTAPYDGIDACSDNNTITGNRVINSTGEAAIRLDSLCTESDSSASGVGNSVSNNRITVACVGILSDPASGLNTIGTNYYVDVQHHIVYGAAPTCGPHQAPRQRAPKHAKHGPVSRITRPARF